MSWPTGYNLNTPLSGIQGRRSSNGLTNSAQNSACPSTSAKQVGREAATGPQALPHLTRIQVRHFSDGLANSAQIPTCLQDGSAAPRVF